MGQAVSCAVTASAARGGRGALHSPTLWPRLCCALPPQRQGLRLLPEPRAVALSHRTLPPPPLETPPPALLPACVGVSHCWPALQPVAAPLPARVGERLPASDQLPGWLRGWLRSPQHHRVAAQVRRIRTGQPAFRFQQLDFIQEAPFALGPAAPILWLWPPASAAPAPPLGARPTTAATSASLRSAPRAQCPPSAPHAQLRRSA